MTGSAGCSDVRVWCKPTKQHRNIPWEPPNSFQVEEKLAHPPIKNPLSCPISTKWSYYVSCCLLSYNFQFKSQIRATEQLWLEKTSKRSPSPSTTTMFTTKWLNHVLSATADQAVSTINTTLNIVLYYAYTLLIFLFLDSGQFYFVPLWDFCCKASNSLGCYRWKHESDKLLSN